MQNGAATARNPLPVQGDAMFERFYRSWDLVKASASVLRQDKELLLFPLISSGALILVALCFLIPAAGLGALDGLERNNLSAGHYLLAFLFYFSQYFVIFFFKKKNSRPFVQRPYSQLSTSSKNGSISSRSFAACV